MSYFMVVLRYTLDIVCIVYVYQSHVYEMCANGDEIAFEVL